MNELKLLLTKLEGKNTPTDAILLCETFLNKDTAKLIKIPNYTIHYINRTNQKGGETTIMIGNRITHKRRKDLEIMVEREVESTFIEMTAKNGKHFALGSTHRAPNTSEVKLTEHICDVNNKVKLEKGKKELVLRMDHNLELLKSHEHHRTQSFLNQMLDLGLIPIIT